ncbi:MAG TPA: hypothetical protein VGM50_19065 [Gemmatimonadaceae bacterium]|jgi:type VI protein secretion system component Hcp
MRDIQILISRFAVACVATSASAIATRDAHAQAQAQADRIIATITHPTLGAIPPAPCATSPVVSSFQETTPSNAAPQAGSFAVDIQSTCVAAFAQAAGSGTRMSAQFAYMAGNTPIMTYTLTNAFIGQVELVLQQSGSGLIPTTRIQIAAPQVSVTYPKAKDVAQASKTSEPVRTKAPAFQLRTASRIETSGESWATGGVRATMTVATDNPAMNVTFPVTAFHVVDPVSQILWSVPTPGGMTPAPGNAMIMRPSTYLDFTKGIDAASVQLHNAAPSHAALKTGTLSLIGSHGAAGITVSTAGIICTDQVNGTSETLSLSGTVSITDAGSNRKASFVSGEGSSGPVYIPGCR